MYEKVKWEEGSKRRRTFECYVRKDPEVEEQMR